MYLESNGQFRTDSLFRERINKRHKQAGVSAVYCLSERQDKGDLSRLYNIFIESVDEYDFAVKAFGSKAHLDKLKSIKWFMDGWNGCLTFRGYNAWLDDMEERDRSTAKQVIMVRASEGDVTAAKRLYDMSKTTSSKGRPRKEDIKREAVAAAEEKEDVDNDLKRLNVVKIRG